MVVYYYSIIKNTIDLAFKFKNNSESQNNGCFSWGEGYINEIDNYLYLNICLVFCWGKKLYIMRCPTNKGNEL